MSKYALLPYRRPNEGMGFFRDFDREFFAPFFGTTAAFRTDIVDEGDHYLLESELPGFSREDIRVSVEGDQLVIRAEHEEKNEEKDDRHFVHRERTYGTYTRRFDIDGINVESIGAKYENGILRLTLPKEQTKPAAGRSITIE